MPTSSKIARSPRKLVAAWISRPGELPKASEVVDEFFQQMESYPNRPEDGEKSARSSFDYDVVHKVACEAEKKLGNGPEKAGWLTWLGGILREEKALLRHLRDVARSWPPLKRQIFEFYYVDGMALLDIARISGCTARTFEAHLAFIQFQVRREMIREALSESKSIPAKRVG
ncbi:MAG TPA: hypothetical protein VGC39_07415 [Candidatus Methylacidiphilales bacterium]